MVMQDMRKTPQEMEDNSPEAQSAVYPYGLSLSLTQDELEKLGLDCADEDCRVGNFLHLHCLAEVTGIHKTQMDGGDQTCINLQIKFMSAEDEDAENDEADEDMSYGTAAGY